MRLIHYSNRYLDDVRDVAQGGTRFARRGDKPNGLWVSVEGDDDWPSWCLGEQYRTDYLTHPTGVVLREEANVLHLDTAFAVMKFHRRHRCTPEWATDAWRRSKYPYPAISWHDVAQEHDGIIIAPYQWDLRLDDTHHWYYSWDCASGCIWNARAVAELIPLPILQLSDDRTNAGTDATVE